MSYLLDKTNNNSPKITVADGTFDNTSTSLTLVGRAFLGWGEPFNENFLALLENFNDVKAPRSPITGQLWYDSSTGKMKFYTGAVFTPLAVFPPASEGYLYDNGSGITQWVSTSQLTSNLNKTLFPTVDVNSPTYNKDGYLVKNPDGSYSWVTGDTLLNKVFPPNTTTNGNGAPDTGVLTKNPDGSYNWVSLDSLAKKTELEDAKKYLVPVGAIMMWAGTVLSIPSGWALCDGTRGTPDLRDRFIIGAGTTIGNTYAVGNTGGSADAIVVSHSHQVFDLGHKHSTWGEAYTDPPFGYSSTQTNMGSRGQSDYDNFLYNSSTSTADISLSTEGVSGINKNLPPYYALAFIMKLSPTGTFTGVVGSVTTTTTASPPIYNFVSLTGTGQYQVPPGMTTLELVIVAGGGAGGGNNNAGSWDGGAGGGAGGVIKTSLKVFSGVKINYSVGGGGAAAIATAGTNGTNTTFGNFTAIGGGGGGGEAVSYSGRDGGSGGGGMSFYGRGGPGKGTPGQGNDGGTGAGDNGFNGGGGGAGGVGYSTRDDLGIGTGIYSGGLGVSYTLGSMHVPWTGQGATGGLAGGGGAGGGQQASLQNPKRFAVPNFGGGDGGFGQSYNRGSPFHGSDGTVNTGGGGGGGGGGYSGLPSRGGAGGSGVIFVFAHNLY